MFKQNAMEADRLAEKQTAQQAEKVARSERLEAMIQNFEGLVNRTLATVGDACTKLTSISYQMSSLASATSQRATVVAGASQEASANVQAMACSAEELSGTVNEIGQQVSRSSDAANKAVE